VEVVRRGRVVETVPLVTSRPVPDAGLLRRVGFGGVLIAIGLIALVLGAILVTLGARAPGAGRDRAATSRR
jgi:hypothetical protein